MSEIGARLLTMALREAEGVGDPFRQGLALVAIGRGWAAMGKERSARTILRRAETVAARTAGPWEQASLLESVAQTC